MSIELKQAAQQALEALLALHAEGARAGWHLQPKWEAQMRAASCGINALRAAIQQAEAQQPTTSEPVVSRNPFASRCYTMSESHLSGHRLIVGFEKLGDAQDAHEWVSRQGRGDFTHPAPGVPDGWSDRHTRVAAFALRRFADAAWERSDEAAQKNYMGNPGDYKAFQIDAKDAEEARSILLTAAQAQKGQQ